MSLGMVIFLVLLSDALAFFIGYSIGFDAGKMWVYRNVEPWEGCE